MRIKRRRRRIRGEGYACAFVTARGGESGDVRRDMRSRFIACSLLAEDIWTQTAHEQNESSPFQDRVSVLYLAKVVESVSVNCAQVATRRHCTGQRFEPYGGQPSVLAGAHAR
jgi:hypothetical protein